MSLAPSNLTSSLLALLLAAGGQVGQDRPAPGQAPARACLQEAAALKRAMREARGRARLDLCRRAVEAYRALRERFPDAPAIGAEAAFRAGELLRADGLRDLARVEFQAAWELGAGTRFRARAGLELGHLLRRRGLAEEALGAYQRVLSAPDTPAPQRDDAALWAGRANAELGRVGEARRLFERVALLAEDPVDRALGYDELALAWIAAGDLVRAAGELARCRAALAEVALEETPLGERVRRALERMRAVDRLREAQARRREGVVVER